MIQTSFYDFFGIKNQTAGKRKKKQKSRMEFSRPVNMISVYTDGSTTNNSRLSKKSQGGIGVWFGPDDKRNVSEPFFQMPITNQRTELAAIVKAIEVYQQSLDSKDYGKYILEICSDSQYAIKSSTVWAEMWKKRGWKKADGSEPLNLDLIFQIHRLMDLYERQFTIAFRHVRAHKSPPKDKTSQMYKDWYGNMMADKLANLGRKKGSL